MPAKNVIKIYIKDSYYHIYNRGVEKRKVFKDQQDYKVFLKYLKQSLNTPPDPKSIKQTFTLQGETFKGVPRQVKNFHKEIILLAYCLMPNHFHLLIKQNSSKSIELFMRSISTRYSMYFNKKYQRVGSLFQGPYKAVHVKDEVYLLHLSRYIHLNPIEFTNDLTRAFSSYSEYLNLRKTKWVKPEVILSSFNQAKLPFFKKTNRYQDFVEKYKADSVQILGDLVLDKL